MTIADSRGVGRHERKRELAEQDVRAGREDGDGSSAGTGIAEDRLSNLGKEQAVIRNGERTRQAK